MKKIFLILSVLVSVVLSSTLKDINLDGKWNSSSLKGKTHIVLYMNPSDKDDVMPFLKRLKAKKYPSKFYSTVAIVNLAATWLPNSAIMAMLKKKSKDFPNTEFVFDKDFFVSKAWGLPKRKSTFLVVDKDENIIYKHSGSIDDKVEKEIFEAVLKTMK